MVEGQLRGRRGSEVQLGAGDVYMHPARSGVQADFDHSESNEGVRGTLIGQSHSTAPRPSPGNRGSVHHHPANLAAVFSRRSQNLSRQQIPARVGLCVCLLLLLKSGPLTPQPTLIIVRND